MILWLLRQQQAWRHCIPTTRYSLRESLFLICKRRQRRYERVISVCGYQVIYRFRSSQPSLVCCTLIVFPTPTNIRPWLHPKYGKSSKRMQMWEDPLHSMDIVSLWCDMIHQSNVPWAVISMKSGKKVAYFRFQRLDAAIVDDRDFSYSFFGFKTLERSYLLKMNGKIVERPQHMLMRVAIGMFTSWRYVNICYLKVFMERISMRPLRHTIWWANDTSLMHLPHSSTQALASMFTTSQIIGTVSCTINRSWNIRIWSLSHGHVKANCRPQMSSCFLLTMMDDSIDGIFETMKRYGNPLDNHDIKSIRYLTS